METTLSKIIVPPRSKSKTSTQHCIVFSTIRLISRSLQIASPKLDFPRSLDKDQLLILSLPDHKRCYWSLESAVKASTLSPPWPRCTSVQQSPPWPTYSNMADTIWYLSTLSFGHNKYSVYDFFSLRVIVKPNSNNFIGMKKYARLRGRNFLHSNRLTYWQKRWKGISNN